MISIRKNSPLYSPNKIDDYLNKTNFKKTRSIKRLLCSPDCKFMASGVRSEDELENAGLDAVQFHITSKISYKTCGYAFHINAIIVKLSSLV